MLVKMPKTNTNGDLKISPKWIHADLFEYLKKTAQEKHISETTIINQALKLHKEQSEKGENEQPQS